MTQTKKTFDISSATLHILAMAFMLIDHAMKTVIATDSWLFILGRLAYPIFAFLIAEGYFHTHNYRKYLLRMLIFAMISEIPYDLMKSGMVFEWYDQDVLWTFLIALICMKIIDIIKSKTKGFVYVIASIAMCLAGFIAGTFLMVDYGGLGVLMVLIFYFFHKPTLWCRIAQFVLFFVINVMLLGGMGSNIAVDIFGLYLEIPLQGFAVFALIPIWMYHGRQGYHSKPFQYICYAFYPVHMLILYIISTFL